MTPPTASRPRPEDQRFGTVYECPDCEGRYLDERRCPDCHLFTRRVDLGGNCPHCEEPVTINDLAQPATDPVSPPR